VREGMRNVIALYGNKTMFTLPPGFYPRLHGRLADRVEGQRGSSLGWLVNLAVTGALAASALFATAHDRFVPQPRAQMSQPAGDCRNGSWQPLMEAKRFMCRAAPSCMENTAW
jgi:hypothetical protein